jgi:hypothetical protein
MLEPEPEAVAPPESSPEFATILCLAVAVLGDDSKVIRDAFSNGSEIAKHVSTMDLSVIRLRGRHEDARVKRDFAQAAIWLGAFEERFKRIGGF